MNNGCNAPESVQGEHGRLGPAFSPPESPPSRGDSVCSAPAQCAAAAPPLCGEGEGAGKKKTPAEKNNGSTIGERWFWYSSR